MTDKDKQSQANTACVWLPPLDIKKKLSTVGGCAHLLETGSAVLLGRRMAAALAARENDPRAPIVCEDVTITVPAYRALILNNPTPPEIQEACKRAELNRPMHTRSRGGLIHVHGRLPSPYGDALVHPAPVLFNMVSRSIIADPTDPPTWWADIPVRDQYADKHATRFFAWYHSHFGRFIQNAGRGARTHHDQEADQSRFDEHIPESKRKSLSVVAGDLVLSGDPAPGGGQPLCPVHAENSRHGGASRSISSRRSWRRRSSGMTTSSTPSLNHTTSSGTTGS